MEQWIGLLNNLNELEIYHTNVKDLTPLMNSKKLRRLYIHSSLVSDLSPLLNVKYLRWLSVYECPLGYSNYQILPALSHRLDLHANISQPKSLHSVADYYEVSRRIARDEAPEFAALRKNINMQAIAVVYDGIRVLLFVLMVRLAIKGAP